MSEFKLDSTLSSLLSMLFGVAGERAVCVSPSRSKLGCSALNVESPQLSRSFDDDRLLLSSERADSSAISFDIISLIIIQLHRPIQTSRLYLHK